MCPLIFCFLKSEMHTEEFPSSHKLKESRVGLFNTRHNCMHQGGNFCFNSGFCIHFGYIPFILLHLSFSIPTYSILMGGFYHSKEVEPNTDSKTVFKRNRMKVMSNSSPQSAPEDCLFFSSPL